jgi:ABC-type lipoprotein release transport system permease subunit
VTVGDIVSYEHGVQSSYYSLLRLVGVYSQDDVDTRNGHYYALADAVVLPALMTNDSREDYLFLKIDKSRFTPVVPYVGISHLSDIEEAIRELDPVYAIGHHTSFYIDDIMARGIIRYQNWLIENKAAQLTRIQGFLFFAVVLSGIGVRYNLKRRKTEMQMLIARGGSSNQILRLYLQELLSLGLLSTFIAVGLGFLVSRIGFMTTGFFQFTRLTDAPVLLTLDSIIILLMLSFAIPLVMYLIFRNNTRAVVTKPTGHGRLAKLARLVTLFRWDVTLSFLSLVILITMWQSSSIITQVPFFSLLAYGAPFAFFIGIAGLISRSLKTSSNWLSSILRKPLGALASGFGVRRVSQNSMVSGTTVLVVALALSLALNGAVVDATLPNTILTQTRFAIGGDVVFRLEDDRNSLWMNLTEDVANSPDVDALSTITVFGLSLSAEMQDIVEFVAVNPVEYSRVGYDSQGHSLDQSSLNPTLAALDQSPTGVIMTSDVAGIYGLSEGDTLRAFRTNGTEIETIAFNTLGVVDSLPDSMVGPDGYTPPLSTSHTKVGRGQIWMHQEHADTLFRQNSSLATTLCVRTSSNSDGQGIVDAILESDVADAVLGHAVATVISYETSQHSQFVFDRSIDTLLILVTLGSIPVVFVMHFHEHKEERENESALLRSIGIDTIKLHKYQVVEAQSLIIYGILLIAVGAPILIVNSLNVTMFTSVFLFQAFPIPIILAIPWLPIVMLMFYLILCAFTLGFSLSVFSSRMPIFRAARETWEESMHNRREWV